MTSLKTTPTRARWQLAWIAGLVLSSACGPLAAQSARRSSRNSSPRPVRIDPSPASSTDRKKAQEWSRRLGQALRDFERGKFDEAEKRFREFSKLESRHPIARYWLGEIAIEKGEWSTARKVRGKTARRTQSFRGEAVPLTRWSVLAPFAYRGRKSFDAALGPETKPGTKRDTGASGKSSGKKKPPKRTAVTERRDRVETVDLTVRYEGDGRICRWKKAKGPRIDLRRVLDVEGAAVGYGHCIFESRRRAWVLLGIGTADAVKVWLNGALVHENYTRRDIEEDDDLVFVQVERGTNELLLKVDSRGNDFEFYVQVYPELAVPVSKFLLRARAGERALAAKDWEKAESLLVEAEALRPDNPEVAVLLAEVKLRQGNWVAARAWATRALSLRPSSARGLAVYGETLLARGQVLQAFDSFRASYRASDYSDERALRLWLDSAAARNWPLQEGLAHLDAARGARARREESTAAKHLQKAEPLLSGSFVGLADLSLFHRQGGDRKASAELGLRALRLLTPEQVALHLSAEWLLDLVEDLRKTGTGGANAREDILALVARVDPARSEVIRELLALRGDRSSRKGIDKRIESLLQKRPEKALFKEYANQLFEAGEHERCIEISRQGLEKGIVSRTLRYRQAQSLLSLERFDEAEEVFTGLLEEDGWEERARKGLKQLDEKREKSLR